MKRDPERPAPNCRRCPRLARRRRELRRTYPDYHGGPVSAVGESEAALLIVGLAPGLHGAHRTGRPFSGDASGTLLFEALYAQGFANQPLSIGPGDGLALFDCRITNAVKCLPPENRPTTAELVTCNMFLTRELCRPRLVLALGGLAHRAVIRTLGERQRDHVFAHDVLHQPTNAPAVLDSYHCSRYNLNTRRLTPDMFHAVVARARRYLSSAAEDASSAS